MILLLSSKNDKTMDYFSDYVKKENGFIKRYHWEDFRKDSSRVFDGLFRDLIKSTGIYVREPAEFDLFMQLTIDAVYCCLKSHSNVVIPKGSSSNWSKYYHYIILKNHVEEFGLDLMMPETCIGTIVPENKFNTYGVYKPSSNMPGIAVRSNMISRYPYKTSLPTPFVAQREIVGIEIRAHVLDDRIVSMQLLRENNTALDNPAMCSCKEVTLPDKTRQDLVTLTKAEGIRFSGIDLFQDCDNQYWLLEVNPMPGYHSFDEYSVRANNPTSEMLCEALTK